MFQGKILDFIGEEETEKRLIRLLFEFTTSEHVYKVSQSILHLPQTDSNAALSRQNSYCSYCYSVTLPFEIVAHPSSLGGC